MAKKRKKEISFLRIFESETRTSKKPDVKVVVRKGKNKEKVVSVLRSGILDQVWDAHENPVAYYSRIIKKGVRRSLVYCPFEDDKEVFVSTEDIPSYLSSIIDDEEISEEEYGEWKENGDENHVGVWLEQTEQHMLSTGGIEYRKSYIELKHGLVSYIEEIFGDIVDLDKITEVLVLPTKVILADGSAYYKPLICVYDGRDVIKIIKQRENVARKMDPLNEVVMHQTMFQTNNKCPALRSVSETVEHSMIIRMQHVGETLYARATKRDGAFLENLSNGSFSYKLMELFSEMIDCGLTHNDMHLDNIYENQNNEYCLLDFANAQQTDARGDYTYDWMQLRIGAVLFDDRYMKLYIHEMGLVKEFLLKKDGAIIDKTNVDSGNVASYFKEVVLKRLNAAYDTDEKRMQLRKEFEEVQKQLHSQYR